MGEKRPDTEIGGGLTSERLLAGVIALLAADRDERADELPPRRSELVLSEIGFSAGEIAISTGKNKEAVRSVLRRSPSKASRK